MVTVRSVPYQVVDFILAPSSVRVKAKKRMQVRVVVHISVFFSVGLVGSVSILVLTLTRGSGSSVKE